MKVKVVFSNITMRQAQKLVRYAKKHKIVSKEEEIEVEYA